MKGKTVRNKTPGRLGDLDDMASRREGTTPGGRPYRATTWKTKKGEKIFHVAIPSDNQPARGKQTMFEKVRTSKTSQKTISDKRGIRNVEKGPTVKRNKPKHLT
jgi:hypothetical protein